MKEHLLIVIAEPSDVVRRGVSSILTDDEAIPVTIFQVERTELLREAIVKTRPDAVVINPAFGMLTTPASMRREFPYTRSVMLSYLPGDASTNHLWDDVISVWDSAETIRERVLHPFQTASTRVVRHHEPLSEREKDIVVCMARGLTNRQIADTLNLSHHTVGTHRRNIFSKLGIHTASGVAVWAVGAKLVDIEETVQKKVSVP